MLIILLILIFCRPFISSLTFPYLNFVYSSLLIGFLCIWVIYRKLPYKEITPLKYPLILFCLALSISIAFSKDRMNSLSQIYQYISGLALFLIAAFLDNKEKKALVTCLVLAGFVISLLAIYQYFFGFMHILNYMAKTNNADPFALDYIRSKRIFFPFVTPNILGGYLAMIIPLSLTQKNKILFIAPLVLALLLTKSLGALLSIFIGIGIYLYLRKDMSNKKFILLIILAASCAILFILRQAQLREHVLPAFSLIKRLAYWKDTLKIIASHPLVGIGLGNFNLTLSRYAHNSYLQLWAETGILGLISVLWLIGNALSSTLRNINNSNCKAEIISLLTASIIFLIHNLLDFSFFLPEVSLIWWVILGLPLTLAIQSHK